MPYLKNLQLEKTRAHIKKVLPSCNTLRAPSHS